MSALPDKAARPYSPVRRIVTGHNAEGRSIFSHDGNTPNVFINSHGALIAQVPWATDCAPASCSEDKEPAAADRLFSISPSSCGTILRIVDFPPDQSYDSSEASKAVAEIGANDANGNQASRHFFFHKTQTLDYAIVLEGEIWALMDIGETLMKAGDVLIQRATNHSWANRSDQNCRVAFVLIDAK
jgi:hypothetical protein